jgi:hypothetical protein
MTGDSYHDGCGNAYQNDEWRNKKIIDIWSNERRKSLAKQQ